MEGKIGLERKIAVVGVGWSGFKPFTTEEYRELIFEAAVKAYEDAGGINPRKDVDGFIGVAEDLWEGISIADEYYPDQVGAVFKPENSVSADGIVGFISACMMIQSGVWDTAVVEAHSKISEVLSVNDLLLFALDPVFNRPLWNVDPKTKKPVGGHPYMFAGLEMNRYLAETGTTVEQCAKVVVKNYRNALKNPFAAYGSNLTVEDVICSKVVSHPLKELDASKFADGCVVVVLAGEEVAKKYTDTPIWVKGYGFCSETSWLECHDWGDSVYTRISGEMAYKMAGIKNPRKEVNFAEVDDTFSYKELQNLEALKIFGRGEAGKFVEENLTAIDGDFPVNPSGGSLGQGNLFCANGLQKILGVVLQLRNEAGKFQVSKAEVGLAQAWRGIPTTSGAVTILGR